MDSTASVSARRRPGAALAFVLPTGQLDVQVLSAVRPPRGWVITSARKRQDQRLPNLVRLEKTAGQVAEARGFEPRMGANPNRISSAAP